MIKIVGAIGIILLFTLSCKPERIEANGFYSADFFTNPDESQTFEYYFDDGELVAGGLDDYVVKIESENETFSSVELILIKYKKNINELPDSLIPLTYFMGIQYNGEMNKAVNISFNHNYPYNNVAHQNYAEYLFFKKNINSLQLYRIEYDEKAALYFDSDIKYFQHPFEVTDNDIKFTTDNKNAFFGFCWREKTWTDTIRYDQSSMSQVNIYSSNKAYETNNNGTFVENEIFYLNYDVGTLIQTEGIVSGNNQFYNMNLIIQNPGEGEVSHTDIYLDLLLEEVTSENTKIKSYLKITENTEVNMVEWPEYGERGILNISGTMKSELTQTNISIDLNINFFRQR
jgi:hypothetical protein